MSPRRTGTTSPSHLLIKEPRDFGGHGDELAVDAEGFAV